MYVFLLFGVYVYLYFVYMYVACMYSCIYVLYQCVWLYFSYYCVVCYICNWQGRTALADCQINNQSINEGVLQLEQFCNQTIDT